MAKSNAAVMAVRVWWPHAGYGGYYVAEDLEDRGVSEKADLIALLKSVREDHPDVQVSTNAIRGNPVPMLIGAAQGSRLAEGGTGLELDRSGEGPTKRIT